LSAEVPAVFGADLTGDVESLLAEGDTVVLEIRLRSLLPNGRRYDNAYCFLFTLRDGRIHRIREHLDTHRGLLAFGLVDEPG
jgi:ketosteroid isomerase-like protein